jgi:uncharacterized protein
MATPPLTVSVYAALLALMFFGLSIRTILARGKFQVAVGDAGHPGMLRVMRVHANFAEYVPLCLFLIYLVEIQGSATWLIHALGAALLLGRALHAYGVSQSKEKLIFRQAGMVSTFTVMLVAAVRLLVAGLL